MTRPDGSETVGGFVDHGVWGPSEEYLELSRAKAHAVAWKALAKRLWISIRSYMREKRRRDRAFMKIQRLIRGRMELNLNNASAYRPYSYEHETSMIRYHAYRNAMSDVMSAMEDVANGRGDP